MNRTIAALSLIIFTCTNNAMEENRVSWREITRTRILLVKKNSNPDLSSEAIAYAQVTKDNRDSLNVPVKDGNRAELPLRLAIEAYYQDKQDTEAVILIQQLLSSGADANIKSKDGLSPREYAESNTIQEVIDAIETFESLSR